MGEVFCSWGKERVVIVEEKLHENNPGVINQNSLFFLFFYRKKQIEKTCLVIDKLYL